MYIKALLGMPLCLLLIATTVARADEASESAAIGVLLDDFHAAASEADKTRYLGYFAPEGVFMGTDDWERWPLSEFRGYVEERFKGGVGWHYVSEQRHLGFASDGNTAWFDEVMVSTRWGRFRGTGVLTKTDGAWKIAHYSLTALVPNESFEDVSKITTAGFEARSADE